MMKNWENERYNEERIQNERMSRKDFRSQCITEKEISEWTEIGSNTVEKENTSVIWEILEYPQQNEWKVNIRKEYIKVTWGRVKK